MRSRGTAQKRAAPQLYVSHRNEGYYLTSAAIALNDIALARVKVSRFADLNDPFELLAANIVGTEVRDMFEGLKRYWNDALGMICFSRKWSNPLLWGHYADKHTGIALGFEVPEEDLIQVAYKSRRVRINFEPSTKTYHLKKKGELAELLVTKFSDWKYEEEWRMLVKLHLATRESGLYFVDFSERFRLKEVILGPRCELSISKA